jgi:hypothetical protein
MPFITTYTIQTTGGPLAAYDYNYTPTGLAVLPLNDNGIMPNAYTIELPYDQYQGMKRHDTRTPTDPDPYTEPAPIETTPADLQPEPIQDQAPAPEVTHFRTCDNCGQPTTDPDEILCANCKPRKPAPIEEQAPAKSLGSVLDTLEFNF